MEYLSEQLCGFTILRDHMTNAHGPSPEWWCHFWGAEAGLTVMI